MVHDHIRKALTPYLAARGIRRVGDPRISPDGSRIVFSLRVPAQTGIEDQENLWVSAVDGSGLTQLTTGGQDSGAKWAPDGESIAFSSSSREGTRLCVVVPGSFSPVEALTRHEGDISSIVSDPSGRRIAYVADFDPDTPNEDMGDLAPRVVCRVDFKRDGAGYLGNLRHHVWLIDLDTRKRRRLTNGPHQHRDPIWSPSGDALAVIVEDWASGQSHVLVVDVDGNEVQRVIPGGMVFGHAWYWNGKRLVFAGETEWTYQPQYFELEIATGHFRRITHDTQVWQCGPIERRNDKFVFTGLRAGTTNVYELDPKSGSIETLVVTDGVCESFSIDSQGRCAVQSYQSFMSVGEVIVHDLERATSSVITDFNASLIQEIPFAVPDSFEIFRGGFKIDAWTLPPPNLNLGEKVPLVLFVHGGPEGSSIKAFNPMEQCLASNGYCVATANIRGSLGYGREFVDAVLGDWGDEPFKDVLAVLDEAASLPYVDPDRVAIMGGSYGGYITALAIGRDQRFKAAIAIAAPFDLSSQYLEGDLDHYYGDKAWGGPPQTNREWYELHSPSTYAHMTRTPTLIVHGDQDQRVPLGQGVQMFTALRKAGCEAELVVYPGQTHAFAIVGPSVVQEDFLTRCLEWLGKYV